MNTHLLRSTTTSLKPCRLSLHGELRILFLPSSPQFDSVGHQNRQVMCVKNLLVAAIEGTPITALATRKRGNVTAFSNEEDCECSQRMDLRASGRMYKESAAKAHRGVQKLCPFFFSLLPPNTAIPMSTLRLLCGHKCWCLRILHSVFS